MQRAWILGVLVTLLGTATASAGVLVDLQPAVYSPGATSGYVDVTVSGQPIDGYSVQFQITGGTPSLGYEPQFTADNLAFPGSYSGDSTFLTGSYVFASDFDSPDPLGSTVKDTPGYLTTLNTSDFTNDFNDVPLTSANDLLARLDFSLPAGAQQGQFTISMVLNDPSGNPVSLFTDLAGDDISIGGTLSETITVGAPGPNVLPEPGTFGMLLLGVTGLGWLRRRRA